jgi:hypothetical protein
MYPERRRASAAGSWCKCVDECSRDGLTWPLFAAANDFGISWLLEHGASLRPADTGGRAFAHALARGAGFGSVACRRPVTEGINARWLRRIIAAEPDLLEARDAAGLTPLMVAAGKGSDAAVAALLELGADVGAATAAGDTALSLACGSVCLPLVQQLGAADAASATALPPGSAKAKIAANRAVAAAVVAFHRCGRCTGRCASSVSLGNCAEGLGVLRSVLAAGVREAVGSSTGRSFAHSVVGWVGAVADEVSCRANHAVLILEALRSGGVDALSWGRLVWSRFCT